jgi:RNA polymerase sigma-70 factor (ECF subfamily)
MFRVAHNHVMDHFRATKPDVDLPIEQLESPGAGPEQQSSEAEQARALKRAVSGLPAEQKEAILLRLEGGFDLQAIADITGVNRETAKSRLRYAVDKLKAALQE